MIANLIPHKNTLGTIAAAAMIATGIAGCGQEAKIDRADADAAIASLDGVDRALSSGRCDVALQRAASLGTQIDDLPNGTGRQLKRSLQNSADRLATLVASQCQAQPETLEPTEPATDETPTEPDEPKKEKKDKDHGYGQGDTDNTLPQEEPPGDLPPGLEKDDSGGVAPGANGVLGE